MSVIHLHPLFPRESYEGADAMVVRFSEEKGDCAWFVKQRECTMAEGFKGTPCNDYTCSACGKMHCAPQVHRFCPRCGSLVVAVIKDGEEGNECAD